MKLSIIIPAYNEEKTIVDIIEKVIKQGIPGFEKEIIVVDDGSKDATVDLIKKRKFSNITLLQHTLNKGKGAAVITGMQKASGDYVIIQDADMEYDPKDIPKLIAPLKKNKNIVVYGTRLKRMPNFLRDERTLRFFLHYLGNKSLSFFTSMLYGKWITDMETGYKIFPRSSMKDIVIHARSFDFEPEITAKFLKKGYEIVELPISTNPRDYTQGKKLNTFKDGPIALWTLIKYRFVN